MQENVADDEFGGVEIWFTNLEDEEVFNPTHGKAFVAKEEGSEVAGRCLMMSHPVNAETQRVTVKSCFGLSMIRVGGPRFGNEKVSG